MTLEENYLDLELTHETPTMVRLLFSIADYKLFVFMLPTRCIRTCVCMYACVYYIYICMYVRMTVCAATRQDIHPQVPGAWPTK